MSVHLRPAPFDPWAELQDFQGTDYRKSAPLVERGYEAAVAQGDPLLELALDEAGIEIPYPHLQLFLEKIEDRVWERAGAFPPLAALEREAPPPED